MTFRTRLLAGFGVAVLVPLAVFGLGMRREMSRRFSGPLARAVELEGKVAIFHNNLGKALEATGHFTAAVEAYRAALAVEGTYGPAATNLARVESLKEDPATPPVDLVEVAKRFRDEIETWRQ